MFILIILLAIVLLLSGFEMFLVLGLPALATKEVFYGSIPDPAIVQKIFGGIDHTTLLAIPFFIFAAHLMGSGQIAKSLTGLVRALIGHTRGGMGHTVIGGSMAFGSVSGSAPATVAVQVERYNAVQVAWDAGSADDRTEVLARLAQNGAARGLGFFVCYET